MEHDVNGEKDDAIQSESLDEDASDERTSPECVSDERNSGDPSSSSSSSSSTDDIEGGNQMSDGHPHEEGVRTCGHPITLKFTDVEYKVMVQLPTPWWTAGRRRKSMEKERQVLFGVSGAALPGEILALMGPSGSGKTTMLNILSGRIQESGGKVRYNEIPHARDHRKKIGFVTQDDVFFVHLTVYETLLYAAFLRLPRTMSYAKKVARVNDVISELGLERCRNTSIGGPLVRGVSGGERKRVNIGHEMVFDPPLLFLDEPTSGLDSTSALRLLETLCALASCGRTIVTTIHQPSSQMFRKFDKLFLLTEGHCIYFGVAKEAVAYFASVGYRPGFTMNPADFLIDMASGNVRDHVAEPTNPPTNQDEVKHRNSAVAASEYLIRCCESRLGPSIKKASMVGIEEKWTMARRRNRRQLMKKKKKRAPTPPLSSAPGASWSEQCRVLIVRGFKERRHDVFDLKSFLQIMGIAVFVAVLWSGSQNDRMTMSAIEDKAGLLFYIIALWGLIPLYSAVLTFPQERKMLHKELALGMYDLSSYFTAKMIVDLPLAFVLPTLFICIVYWPGHLILTVGRFLLTELLLLLDVLVAQSLGLAIGAALTDLKSATTVGSVVSMATLLAGGFYISNIPKWCAWIRFLSFFYHGYSLLIKIQVDEHLLQSFCEASQAGCKMRAGGRLNVLLLFVMLIAFRLVAYVFLRRQKRPA